eukprot:jgi/Botrbrau1/14724/Bobra.0108s0071.2
MGMLQLKIVTCSLFFDMTACNLGCLDPQCVLCEHNPHRRCSVNFAPKYLVNDVLKAKCEAPIRVEVIDRATGLPLGEDIPDVHLEMCILDGNAYDAKCLEAGQERDEDLDACSLLSNNKMQPLLTPGSAASHNSQSKVIVQLVRGMAQLPDLHVTDSSEAMLSGRKPPFRLLVRAIASDGRKVNIRHAVSEGFVVATRRTRTAGKVEIPNVDDHISKLEHMGKETVKKLQDIKLSAIQAGIEVSVPVNSVNKVGEFRKLALLAESDGHLRQKLQQVLKLSKEKWDDARDHAMRAVVADSRMRIWYADKSTLDVGLLFTCRLGNIDLERPVGLLQKKSQTGAQTTMEATLMSQQTPSQREKVRQLQPTAVAAWWQAGHTGWAIYPVDSETFMSAGTLDTLQVQHEQVVVPQLAAPVNLGYDRLSPPPKSGNFTAFPTPPLMRQQDTSVGFRPPDLPASGDLRKAVAGNPPGSTTAGSAAGTSNGQRTSPFEGGRVGPRLSDVQSSGQYGNFSGILGQALTSVDLNRLQSSGFNLSNFPSLPNAVASGELEQFLHQLGGESPFRGPGHPGSLGIGKLESMELPDAIAAVAMLHDMPDARLATTGMPRASSGLESMQSIEQALGNVEQDILDHVADEYNRHARSA